MAALYARARWAPPCAPPVAFARGHDRHAGMLAVPRPRVRRPRLAQSCAPACALFPPRVRCARRGRYVRVPAGPRPTWSSYVCAHARWLRLTRSCALAGRRALGESTLHARWPRFVRHCALAPADLGLHGRCALARLLGPPCVVVVRAHTCWVRLHGCHAHVLTGPALRGRHALARSLVPPCARVRWVCLTKQAQIFAVSSCL